MDHRMRVIEPAHEAAHRVPEMETMPERSLTLVLHVAPRAVRILDHHLQLTDTMGAEVLALRCHVDTLLSHPARVPGYVIWHEYCSSISLPINTVVAHALLRSVFHSAVMITISHRLKGHSMKLYRSTLVLALACLTGLVTGGPVRAQTYDLTGDFSNTSNPTGAWSYGQSSVKDGTF